MAGEVPLTLTAQQARTIIRDIAQDSARVFVIPHAKRAGRTRKIAFKQIIDCLLKGTISEGPYIFVNGKWRCNVRRHAAGEEMTCVVEFDWPKRLLIVTVF